MNDSLKALLQIDTLGQAVGTYQNMPVVECKFFYLHFTFLVGKTTCYNSYCNILVLALACKPIGKIFAHIFSCLNVLTEYNRVHVVIQRYLNNIQRLLHLFVCVSRFYLF